MQLAGDYERQIAYQTKIADEYAVLLASSQSVSPPPLPSSFHLTRLLGILCDPERTRDVPTIRHGPTTSLRPPDSAVRKHPRSVNLSNLLRFLWERSGCLLALRTLFLVRCVSFLTTSLTDRMNGSQKCFAEWEGTSLPSLPLPLLISLILMRTI
jgi:hypothetical protein